MKCIARLYHGHGNQSFKIEFATLRRSAFDSFELCHLKLAAKLISGIVVRSIILDIRSQKLDVGAARCFAKGCARIGTGFLVVTAFTRGRSTKKCVPVTMAATKCGLEECRAAIYDVLEKWAKRKWTSVVVAVDVDK